jgi:hypothetical protein
MKMNLVSASKAKPNSVAGCGDEVSLDKVERSQVAAKDREMLREKAERLRKALGKKAKRGMRGYPVGTIAFYGPDDKTATKVVAGIVPSEGAEPDPMTTWFAQGDVRNDEAILGGIKDFLLEHAVLTVVMPDRVIGCPHEEGIDYPEGEACPSCPFWKGRDRWTGERVH